MKIRRKFISEVRGDKTIQKCLASVILLKHRIKSSRIHQYSLNKLRKVLGISHKTAKKYEQVLLEKKYIHFEGNMKNRTMVINRITSHTSNRNINIESMDYSSFKTVYKSLQVYIFIKILYNKEFMQHLLQARHNPKSDEQRRIATRKVKDLVKQGKLDGVDVQYKEYGLSLKRIAKEIGCCIRTVQRVINFAVMKQWVERQHNYEWIYAPHVNYMDLSDCGYTFTTRHKICIVHPNTYKLDPSIFKAFDFWCGVYLDGKK